MARPAATRRGLLDPAQGEDGAGLPIVKRTEETTMNGSTVLEITLAVALFAAFAGSLAWAQQEARSARRAAPQAVHRKRRPF